MKQIVKHVVYPAYNVFQEYRILSVDIVVLQLIYHIATIYQSHKVRTFKFIFTFTLALYHLYLPILYMCIIYIHRGIRDIE